MHCTYITFKQTIVGDIDSKGKGSINKKKRAKKEKAESIPSAQMEAEELKQDEDETKEEGPTENLMEKGKKISLDDF